MRGAEGGGSRDARPPRGGAAARAVPRLQHPGLRDNGGWMSAGTGRALPCTAAAPCSSRGLFGADTGFAPRILTACSMGWYLRVSLLVLSPRTHGSSWCSFKECTRSARRSPDSTDLWKRVGEVSFLLQKVSKFKIGQRRIPFPWLLSCFKNPDGTHQCPYDFPVGLAGGVIGMSECNVFW